MAKAKHEATINVTVKVTGSLTHPNNFRDWIRAKLVGKWGPGTEVEILAISRDDIRPDPFNLPETGMVK